MAERTVTVLIVLAILCFYFLPVIIADIRGAAHRGAIGTINLFLGWTILGWLAALIWAVSESVESKPAAPAKKSAWSKPFYED